MAEEVNNTENTENGNVAAGHKYRCGKYRAGEEVFRRGDERYLQEKQPLTER